LDRYSRASANQVWLYSAKERVYRNRDEINVSREGLGAVYEQKLKGFFT